MATAKERPRKLSPKEIKQVDLLEKEIDEAIQMTEDHSNGMGFNNLFLRLEKLPSPNVRAEILLRYLAVGWTSLNFVEGDGSEFSHRLIMW